MVQSDTEIINLITANRSQIAGYGAKSLGLFGSFIKGSVNNQSDVDLLVEFEQGKKTYDNFIELALFLERLFQRKVELITSSSLSKYIRPHIEKTIKYVSISI